MTRLLAGELAGEHSQLINRVIGAALAAADPRAAVRAAIKGMVQGGPKPVGRPGGQDDLRLDLSSFRRVRVIGAGKAAQAMARGLLDELGEQVTDGLLITKHLERVDPLPERIRVLAGGHPVPNEASLASTRALVEFLQESGQGVVSGGEELVFCLISGGGSALMTLPVEGLALADLQELTRELLACGATIGEINTLRKHLDRVKGGGLARLAAPAHLATLILSDVIGSPLDVIASGPTVADLTTYADALDILRQYRIEARAPENVRAILQRGARGELSETVKPGDPLLAQVTNRVIASNFQAAEAAVHQAKQEGFNTLLLTTYLQGEASQAGTVLAGILKQAAQTSQPLARPACIVVGGETTVTLHGKGLGGRSQELALGAAFLLSGLPDVALLAMGTDGEDGPTDAAGAVVSGETIRRARTQGLDPLAALQNNDSYPFFASLGNLIITGPTGTNVNDLVFLFAF